MTEFEMQVAEALSRPLEGSYLPSHGISLMLAPRVAAAIEAACAAGIIQALSAKGDDRNPDAPHGPRAEALLALRGGA